MANFARMPILDVARYQVHRLGHRRAHHQDPLQGPSAPLRSPPSSASSSPANKVPDSALSCLCFGLLEAATRKRSSPPSPGTRTACNRSAATSSRSSALLPSPSRLSAPAPSACATIASTSKAMAAATPSFCRSSRRLAPPGRPISSTPLTPATKASAPRPASAPCSCNLTPCSGLHPHRWPRLPGPPAQRPQNLARRHHTQGRRPQPIRRRLWRDPRPRTRPRRRRPHPLRIHRDRQSFSEGHRPLRRGLRRADQRRLETAVRA